MPVRDRVGKANPALLQGGKEKLDISCMPQRPDGGRHRLLSESKNSIKFHGKVRDTMFGSSASCWRVSVKDGMRKLQVIDDYKTSKHKVEDTTYSSSLEICDNLAEKTIGSASSDSLTDNACVRIESLSSDNFFRITSGGTQERTSNRTECAARPRSLSSYRTECSESFRECQPLPQRKPKSLLQDQTSVRNSIDEVCSVSESSDSESHAVPLYIAGFEAELLRFHERYDRDMSEMHSCLESIHKKLEELGMHHGSVFPGEATQAIKSNMVNSQVEVSKPLQPVQPVNRTDLILETSNLNNAVADREMQGNLSIEEGLHVDSNYAVAQQQNMTGSSTSVQKLGLNRKANVHRTGFRVKNNKIGGTPRRSKADKGKVLLPLKFGSEGKQFWWSGSVQRKCHKKNRPLKTCLEEEVPPHTTGGCTAELGSPNSQLVPTGVFRETVNIMRALVRNFSTTLIEAKEEMLKRLGIELRTTVLALLSCELLPDAQLADSEHLKYGVQAFVNRTVFEEFETESYGVDNDPSDDHCASHSLAAGRDILTHLAAVSPSEAISEESPVYNRSFHLFCRKKFQLFQKKLDWFEKWPEKLVEAFLDAMKYAWMVHKLAFAFQQPDSVVTLFYVNEWAEFDPVYMEAVERAASSQKFSSTVQFMVIPGFEIRDKIIKSQVYLNPITVWCPPKSTTSLLYGRQSIGSS
ncbi:hypothetical protein O6H91_22G025700 [Diphasiastrum complanatum]|uniref:Uncharacterized protein n=4 Tax=Diphasiastrum complanatum TaxID=34168 RepID=A0ACC2ADW3_DIPCM|nr:hypothetical protein O6H91_22G025700 [Diphasiastrum complanatum]KAJ7515742.1 hypothetical protein O6H91_22G025700 [Diphasiastrum complanatum]